MMSILAEHLNQMLNKEIVVVMDDGMAFKGSLKRFDDECVVLTNVMEAQSTDARWREALVTTSAREGSAEGGGIMMGDTGTSMLKLTTAIVSIPHISRIWTWTPEKPEGY